MNPFAERMKLEIHFTCERGKAHSLCTGALCILFNFYNSSMFLFSFYKCKNQSKKTQVICPRLQLYINKGVEFKPSLTGKAHLLTIYIVIH
jgi:hypothetical protein